MKTLPKTEFYQHKAETWDEKECESIANSTAKDGLGTPYPFKGYMGCSTSIPPKYGSIRYNGGCVREGAWYDGEFFPLPNVHENYEILYVPCWGYRLVKKATEQKA